jgi:predicted nucleic acid-binding protein
MTRILIDTNIILDFALKRNPFYSGSVAVFQLMNEKKIEGFITASSVTDIYYLLSKSKEKSDVRQFIGLLLNFVDVLKVDKSIIIEALNSDLLDFEDAVQNTTAIENDLDIIITRNKKDFTQSPLTILTPDEFLSTLH